MRRWLALKKEQSQYRFFNTNFMRKKVDKINNHKINIHILVLLIILKNLNHYII